MRKPRSNELFDLAPEPKTFVPVEGADHNDLIGVLGLYEYKKLLLGIASRYCDTIINRNLHYGNGCCGLGRTIKSLEDM